MADGNVSKGAQAFLAGCEKHKKQIQIGLSVLYSFIWSKQQLKEE